MKLFPRTIWFKSPPRSDIVIFDRTNSKYITDFILDDLPSFIFDTRPLKIYISFAVILNFLEFCYVLARKEINAGRRKFRVLISSAVIYGFFKFLCLVDWQKGKTSRRKLRGVGEGRFRDVYLLSCFACMKPKVVITYIDNDVKFHRLSKHYRAAEFFAIQNGNRTNYVYEKSGKRKTYHTHFFCFGDYERVQYKQRGDEVEYYYPVGALLGGWYAFRKKSGDLTKYDVSVVSALSNNTPIKDRTYVPAFFESFYLMNRYLAEYVRERGIRLAVLMKGSLGGFEEAYYRNIYGCNVDLVEKNWEEIWSTYRGMDNSDVIVSAGSTAIREAFGWGKKVLYCDFTGTDKYHDYDSMIMLTVLDYDAFKERLDELRAEPSESYRSRTKAYASFLMNYNPDCPPHIFIRQKVLQYL